MFYGTGEAFYGRGEAFYVGVRRATLGVRRTVSRPQNDLGCILSGNI